VAARDYDSRELSVAAGEVVEVLEEVAGWAWCRRTAGERGWVPVGKVGGGP
jgi:SH3-like domain-containing protein